MTEKKIEDGGPAFPSEQGCTDQGWNQTYAPGMSLREWYAGQALIGIIVGNAIIDANRQEQSRANPETFAAVAQEIANAMLRVRSNNG